MGDAVSIERQDYYDFLMSRRSIRSFRDEPVPEQVMRRLLSTACRAPSAHNRQPWRFVVVGPGATRKRLAEEMSAQWREEQRAGGNLTPELEERIQARASRLINAPAVVVLCMTLEDMTAHDDPRHQEAERTMTVQSVALAGGQLLLAVHAEGLGAFWAGAALFAQEAVRKALDLPAAWEPQGMILMGAPLSPGVDRGRKPLDEVVTWR
jgi:coenzyme F420-0:L-glutamate ligase/coenzyme F420-1:gamma-L-glutamate ligase